MNHGKKTLVILVGDKSRNVYRCSSTSSGTVWTDNSNPFPLSVDIYPDSKVHGTNLGPIWGRQDPGGPHVVPMNFAIWVYTVSPLRSKWRHSSDRRDLAISRDTSSVKWSGKKRGIEICEDINQEKFVRWLRALMSFFCPGNGSTSGEHTHGGNITLICL